MSEDASIAEIIDSSSGQPWLIVAVSKFRGASYLGNRVRAEVPRRNEMRNALQTLDDATETVRASMRDFNLSTLLLKGDAHFLNQSDTYRGLADLSDRVKKALGDLPKGKGKHKFFGDERATPHQVCALMVMTLWELVHSASARPNSKKVQKACQKLWAAAGGQPGWSDPDNPSTSTWREHLLAAKMLHNAKKGLIRSLHALVAATRATPPKAEFIHGNDRALYRLRPPRPGRGIPHRSRPWPSAAVDLSSSAMAEESSTVGGARSNGQKAA